MCGIVAYLGEKQAYDIIIEGLRRLEYRGYDSAGVALLNGDLHVYKKKGKVEDLVTFAKDKDLNATLGMGHTRWATHGEPNDINAHPHLSSNGRVAVVHNGIIENHSTLKRALQDLGHEFKSDTDTEVLAHLIEEYLVAQQLDLESAIQKAIKNVVGAFAIVVLDRQNPDVMIGARRSSPLVVGLGDKEYFIASDATPIVKYTDKVIYLKDDEIVKIDRKGGYEVKNIANELQEVSIKKIDLKIEELEKGGYDHFMLKEIFQQPDTIFEAMRGRINAMDGYVRVGGLQANLNKILNAKRFVIVGCGTSWHSGLIGEYLFEELARINVEVEYASEFRYRNPIISEEDVVIALSQSGETADTMSALKLAKEKGALIYGIVNNVGSSISRMTDSGSYIHAGPEIGVASTKAFTSQVTLLTLMALHLAYVKGTIDKDYYRRILVELENMPKKVASVLKADDKIKEIAEEIQHANNVLYLGRGFNFPVALEGALKLKEISYVHAEGYPAAEMKHGPIALIDENMPVVVIATNVNNYDKVLSNIQEVIARKGKVIAIVTEGDEEIKKIANFTIELPVTVDPLTPLLSVIPLQLLAYHIAVLRGCNVDQPRNLAKSVTVE